MHGAIAMEQLSLDSLIMLTENWHEDRNLIDGATDKDQVCKLIQEVGELSDSVCKGQDIKDDIGDCMVVLINIAKRNNVTMQECLQVAYDDIEHRRGRMIDGIFVKEAKPLPRREKNDKQLAHEEKIFGNDKSCGGVPTGWIPEEEFKKDE